MNERLQSAAFWIGFAALVSAVWLAIPVQP